MICAIFALKCHANPWLSSDSYFQPTSPVCSPINSASRVVNENLNEQVECCNETQTWEMNWVPLQLQVTAAGPVTATRALRTSTRRFCRSGRRQPTPVPRTTFPRSLNKHQQMISESHLIICLRYHVLPFMRRSLALPTAVRLPTTILPDRSHRRRNPDGKRLTTGIRRHSQLGSITGTRCAEFFVPIDASVGWYIFRGCCDAHNLQQTMKRHRNGILHRTRSITQPSCFAFD